MDKSKVTDTHARTTGHPGCRKVDPNMWTGTSVYLVEGSARLAGDETDSARGGVGDFDVPQNTGWYDDGAVFIVDEFQGCVVFDGRADAF